MNLSPAPAAGLIEARSELFAGLALVGLANGLTGPALASIRESGALSAVFSTFGISAIVWCAIAVAISSLLRAPAQPIRWLDLAVAAAAMICFLAPPVKLSWVGLTGLATYILCTSPSRSHMHRAGWIVFAITVPMFWVGISFIALHPILSLEAALAGWVADATYVGNVVHFSDGWGYLLVEPGCSSLKNISLAVLCWMLFVQSFSRPSALKSIGWCLLACAATVLINILRLSVLAVQGARFDELHEPTGMIAGWITLVAVVGICWLGTRHGRAFSS